MTQLYVNVGPLTRRKGGASGDGEKADSTNERARGSDDDADEEKEEVRVDNRMAAQGRKQASIQLSAFHTECNVCTGTVQYAYTVGKYDVYVGLTKEVFSGGLFMYC